MSTEAPTACYLPFVYDRAVCIYEQRDLSIGLSELLLDFIQNAKFFHKINSKSHDIEYNMTRSVFYVINKLLLCEKLAKSKILQ